jgi:uncharacterized protein YkwD
VDFSDHLEKWTKDKMIIHLCTNLSRRWLVVFTLLGLSCAAPNASPGDQQALVRKLSNQQGSTTRGQDPAAPAEQLETVTLPESFLSLFEQQVLLAMNRLRSKPQEYARELQRWIAFYHGRLLELPHEVPLETNEGAKALREAINALSRASESPRLVPSRGMSQAARAHVQDLGPQGLTGHTGSDGSDTFGRLDRYGQWQKEAAENIQFGGRTPEEMIQLLVIDDGVPSRGHRENLLNPHFRLTGIACGPHAKLRTMCVITFAAGFQEKP